MAASAASIQGAAVPLPGDVIFAILSKSPVKALCRFRCVSREWCAVISEPAFVAAHRSSFTEPLLVARHFPPEGITQGSDVDLLLMDMDGNVVKTIKGAGSPGVLCSSHDNLICITSGSDHNRLCVMDPATMEEVLVTYSKKSRYIPIHGFGRAAAPSGAYKMLCLNLRSGPTSCEVLTIGDNAGWRKTALPPPRPPNTFVLDSPPVAVNGVLYLLTYFSIRCQTRDTLLCFDLEEEEWHVTEGPPRFNGDDGFQRRITGRVHVTELNGEVCMVQPAVTTCRDGPPRTNIWLLKDFDKGIWAKAFTVVFPYPVRPLRAILHGDSAKLLFYVNTTYVSDANARPGLELHVYDPRTEICTHVMTMASYYYNSRIRLCGSF